MKLVKYPDNTSYINSTVMGQITFRLNSYEDLWHLNQFVDAFKNEYNSKPTILIPNLLDAQADKRFNKGESSGLKLVCNFLNSMDAYFKIFHPHNSEVVEALIDNVEIIDNSVFIESVLYDIRKNLSKADGKSIDETLILVSSDSGGFKPLMKLCEKLDWEGETFSASKSRKYSEGKSELIQSVGLQDFGGKDILIIDDISVYGGTFKGLSKLLKERNCGKLYLAVSHMTVKELGTDPVTNYFHRVFTTNSKFDDYWYTAIEGGMSNLEIIKLF